MVVRPDAGSTWFTRGVRKVAASSFFSDAGHEMATSALPTFLTTTLGAGPRAAVSPIVAFARAAAWLLAFVATSAPLRPPASPSGASE